MKSMISPISSYSTPIPPVMACPGKIRLLVVDDHPVVCEGLRSIVLRSPQIELVGVCWSAEAALRLASNKRVDLMLIDSKMAPMTGLELLWQLNRNQVPCKALVMSSLEVEEEILESIEAGAVGYLSKSSSPTDILKAILSAAAGERMFPTYISAGLDRRTRKSLTPRELEVLNLVSKGLSNKEVGHVLGLSQFTVRNQLKRICTKLDASDRTEAATTAMERGMIRN